jgi:hypothetical protein
MKLRAWCWADETSIRLRTMSFTYFLSVFKVVPGVENEG